MYPITQRFVPMCRFLFILLLLQGLCGYSLMAQTLTKPDTFNRKEKEPNFSGYAEMNYYRHYLWRGAEFGNNDVAQPELLLKYKKFGLLLSANLNYNVNNLPEYYTKKAVFDEQDVELNYENEKGRLEYKLAAMFYFYFHQASSPNTGEFYWRLKYPIAGDLKMFTETAHDIVYYRGAIFNNTGVVWEKDITEKLNAECTVAAGLANGKYNSVYNDLEKGQWNILNAKAELEYSFRKYYVGLMAEWNQYTSARLRAATGLNKTNNYYFSFGINF
jgi:hypothetical protein